MRECDGCSSPVLFFAAHRRFSLWYAASASVAVGNSRWARGRPSGMHISDQAVPSSAGHQGVPPARVAPSEGAAGRRMLPFLSSLLVRARQRAVTPPVVREPSENVHPGAHVVLTRLAGAARLRAAQPRCGGCAPRLGVRARLAQLLRPGTAPAPADDAHPGSAFRQEYIDAHGISKTVEEVINATVKAKAAEPCSFMVRPLPASSQPGGAVEG